MLQSSFVLNSLNSPVTLIVSDHPNIRSFAGLHNLASFDLLRVTYAECEARLTCNTLDWPTWPGLGSHDRDTWAPLAPRVFIATQSNALNIFRDQAVPRSRIIFAAVSWPDPGLSLTNEHYEAHNNNNKPSHHQTAERLSGPSKGPSWYHYHIQGTEAKTQTQLWTHPLILCQF